MVQKNIIMFGLICVLIASVCIPVSTMAEQRYSKRYMAMEEKYLRNKLEANKRLYWSQPKEVRRHYKVGFYGYCAELERRIRQLRMDPEQYFFESEQRERDRTDLIEIRHR